MTTQPAIADHGLIGDVQTAALVATLRAMDSEPAPAHTGAPHGG